MYKTLLALLAAVLSIEVCEAGFQSCGSGWSPWNEFCFRNEGGDKKWSDASNRCATLNGYLAAPQSTAENTYIKQNHRRGNTWLGVQDQGTVRYYYQLTITLRCLFVP